MILPPRKVADPFDEKVGIEEYEASESPVTKSAKFACDVSTTHLLLSTGESSH